MPERIERLCTADFEEAMDFLNLVFSQAHSPHDFARMLPRLYRPTEESMQNNFAIRKNGRIRAVVGLFPITLHAGDRTLKVGGIGGVATHPNERKMGAMHQLMEACIEEMHSQGFQLSCLGGIRQRYGYYGFEKAGTAYSYYVTKNIIRHCLTDTLETGIHFKLIKQDDREKLSHAKELYDTQPLHCNRSPDEFYLYLKSWYMIPWAALDRNGNMIGYIVANGANNQINEILADSPDIFYSMICTWTSEHAGEGTSLFLPPWARDFTRKIGRISENVSIQESYNWRVFDWVEVIRALFAVRSGFSRLADGEVNIGIKNYGITRICVKDGLAVCEQVKGKADVLVDAFTAMRLMFGPLSPDNAAELPDHLFPLFSSWFPLPLCWLPQDSV